MLGEAAGVHMLSLTTFHNLPSQTAWNNNFIFISDLKLQFYVSVERNLELLQTLIKIMRLPGSYMISLQCFIGVRHFV